MTGAKIMSPSLSKVVVIGGSGNLGIPLVSAFKANSFFHLTVLSRKSSKVEFDPSINVIRVGDEYPEQELYKAFKGQDAVIGSFNHQADRFQQGMIDAAIKAGVKRFIPADFGSNGENEAVLELFPRLKGKKAVIEYLKSKESDTFSWTSIITGLFIDQALKNGFMGYKLADHETTIWDSGHARFSCSTTPNIARAVMQVLLHPNETANKYIYTSSFEITQSEILASLEKITGGKAWSVTHVTSEDQIKAGREAMAVGDFVGSGKLALAASYRGIYGADFEKEGKLANAMLGVPKENLDDFLEAIMSHR